MNRKKMHEITELKKRRQAILRKYESHTIRAVDAVREKNFIDAKIAELEA